MSSIQNVQSIQNDKLKDNDIQHNKGNEDASVFIVQSECAGGIFGQLLLFPLLRNLTNTSSSNIFFQPSTNYLSSPNLLIRGTHPNIEKGYVPVSSLTKDSNIPYIIFSGEPFLPGFRKGYPPLAIVATFLPPNPHREDWFWFPYMLFHGALTEHQGLFRGIPNKSPRLKAVGYVSSNPKHHRAKIFHAMFHTLSSDGHVVEKISPPGGWKEVPSHISSYTFFLALENTDLPGYITEKIIHAYVAGCIPIYWGSRKVKEIFNPESMVYVQDFSTFEKCAEYVKELLIDEERLSIMKSAPIFLSPEIEKDWMSVFQLSSNGSNLENVTNLSPRYSKFVHRLRNHFFP
jgi:hypothetical protein